MSLRAKIAMSFYFIFSKLLIEAANYHQWEYHAMNYLAVEQIPSTTYLKFGNGNLKSECNMECAINNNCCGFLILNNKVPLTGKCVLLTLTAPNNITFKYLSIYDAAFIKTNYILPKNMKVDAVQEVTSTETGATTILTDNTLSLSSTKITETTVTVDHTKPSTMTSSGTTAAQSTMTSSGTTATQSTMTSSGTTSKPPTMTSSGTTAKPPTGAEVFPVNVMSIDDYDSKSYLAFGPCNAAQFNVYIVNRNYSDKSITIPEMAGSNAFPEYKGNCVNAAFRLNNILYLQNETEEWSSFDIISDNGHFLYGALTGVGLNNSRYQGPVVMATRIGPDNVVFRYANGTVSCFSAKEIGCPSCSGEISRNCTKITKQLQNQLFSNSDGVAGQYYEDARLFQDNYIFKLP